MNFRKILAIILFVLITIGIGYAIFRLFFGAAPTKTVTPGTNAPVNAGGLPTAVNGGATSGGVNGAPLPPPEVPVSPIAAGGVTQVTTVAPVATTGAAIAQNGSVNYYNRDDGKFYRVNADGKSSLLSGQQFFNVDKAIFDPNGNKAILEYPDGAKTLYDFTKNTQVTLPKHWEDFEFNSTGSQIAAKSIGIDENNRFLVVANPDGSSARAVQELGANSDKVTVAYSPTGQVVATAATGEKCGVDCQQIFLIGQHQENFKSITVEGLDFRPKWAPSGQQLLYSSTTAANDWKPQLWIIDAQGDNIGKNRRSININTWVDKCTFSDDQTVFCAVPQDFDTGAGLRPAIADETPDNIYKIDLGTGLTTQVAIPEGAHTIDKIMLTPDKKMMYFTDKSSGLLNKIQLKK